VLGLCTFGLAGLILIGGRWIELKVTQIAITPPASSSTNPDSKPLPEMWENSLESSEAAAWYQRMKIEPNQPLSTP
jgi:hypothetical protein